MKRHRDLAGVVYRVIFVDPGKPLPAGAMEIEPPELAMLLKVDALRYYETEATEAQRLVWGPTAARTALAKIPGESQPTSLDTK